MSCAVGVTVIYLFIFQFPVLFKENVLIQCRAKNHSALDMHLKLDILYCSKPYVNNLQENMFF